MPLQCSLTRTYRHDFLYTGSPLTAPESPELSRDVQCRWAAQGVSGSAVLRAGGWRGALPEPDIPLGPGVAEDTGPNGPPG